MRALGLFLTGALLWAGPAAVPLSPVERLQEQALEYVGAQAAGLPGAYKFRVVTPPLLPRSTGDLRFEPDHLSRRDLAGRFFASFSASLDGRSLGMVRVDMEGQWQGKVLRTRTGLVRKTVPELAQVEEIDFEGTPPVGALAALPVGFRLRGPVAPGHILTQADLEPVPVIMAGDQVRLQLVSGGLSIALETLARSNGAIGEKVRLELPTTHKIFQAYVIGPDQAQSQWAGEK